MEYAMNKKIALYDDILIEVLHGHSFAEILKLRNVSQCWKRIIETNILCKFTILSKQLLTFDGNGKRRDGFPLHAIKGIFSLLSKYLITIRLTRELLFIDDEIMSMIWTAPCLQNLTICISHLEHKELFRLKTNLANRLTELCLAGSDHDYWCNGKCPSKILENSRIVFERLPGLKRLLLSKLPLMFRPIEMNLSERCPQLTHLYLGRLPLYELNELCGCYSNLQILEIFLYEGTGFEVDWKGRESSDYNGIIAPNLKYFKLISVLDCSTVVTSQQFIALICRSIFTHSSNLDTIILLTEHHGSGYWCIGDEMLRPLRHLHNIKRLSIQKAIITGQTLIEICSSNANSLDV